MALRLSEDGTVVTVLLPERIRGVPGDVAFTSQHPGKGLLLRSVSSPSPDEDFGGRVTHGGKQDTRATEWMKQRLFRQ